MTQRIHVRALPFALLGLMAPAISQATPTLYGAIFETVEVIESRSATSPADGGSGHTFGRTTRIGSHSSMFGIKGEEKLDQDLSAFFQIESSLNANTGTGTLGGRNTGVGLKSTDWGSLVMGHWDSPMKLSSVRADPWRTNTIAGYNSLISSPGFGIGKQRMGTGSPNDATAAFDMRATNTIQYWSPTVANFNARLMVTTSNKIKASTPNRTYDPYMWGFSLGYDNGPLWVSYAYEHRKDYFGINSMVKGVQTSFSSPTFTVGGDETGSSDHAHRFSMGYTIDGTTLGLVYERLNYHNKGSTVVNAMNRYERDAIYASLEQKFAKVHRLRLAYGQTTRIRCSAVGGSCNSDNLGARMFAIGYAYDLSRRTQLVAQYAQINNKSRAVYTFGDNTPPASGAGATLRGISVGMSHRF